MFGTAAEIRVFRPSRAPLQRGVFPGDRTVTMRRAFTVPAIRNAE
jgi:hypothetical protein